jgi:hypothetical protein
MWTPILAWLCVWVPLLGLQWICLTEDPGMRGEGTSELARQAANLIRSRMVFSANLMIGALPVLLWGRLEGFPTLLLANLVGWSWTWVLSGFVHQDPAPDWLSWALGGLLTVKVAAALVMLLQCLRLGYVTWRFPVILLGGWLATISYLVWRLPAQPDLLGSEVVGLAVMIPLARLAACPMAMARNRHG